MAKSIRYKGSNGLRPLWNKKQIQTLFEKLADKANLAIEQLLKRTGDEFVKIARLEGEYIDHTGNLRSSIGYVVVKDGDIVFKDFELSPMEGTDKASGKKEAEQLALELTQLYNKGYVLICLVGMKYAVFVEAMENKDVISNAASKTVDFVKEQSRLLFKSLSK